MKYYYFRRSFEIMKKNLIYLLISACLAMVFVKTDKECVSDSSDCLTSQTEYLLDGSEYSFCAAESEFCAPRPTNIANTQRVQTVSKRTSSVCGKECFAVLRNGKFINRNSISTFQNNIKLFPSGLSEADHHLLSLRKLII